jgi:hypothetical protein
MTGSRGRYRCWHRLNRRIQRSPPQLMRGLLNSRRQHMNSTQITLHLSAPRETVYRALTEPGTVAK